MTPPAAAPWLLALHSSSELDRARPRGWQASRGGASAAAAGSRGSRPRPRVSLLLPDDVLELLEIAREAAAAGEPAPWGPVLPIYPTSPVGVA
ncbi:MAG: hypothetical protein ACKOPN_03740, partial [Prochlorococcaceae cyanobacterium]